MVPNIPRQPQNRLPKPICFPSVASLFYCARIYRTLPQVYIDLRRGSLGVKPFMNLRWGDLRPPPPRNSGGAVWREGEALPPGNSGTPPPPCLCDPIRSSYMNLCYGILSYLTIGNFLPSLAVIGLQSVKHTPRPS